MDPSLLDRDDMIAPDELLRHLAGSLRLEIGPAVGDPFAKTQAFMASVILEKLAGQIRLAGEHAGADRDEQVVLDGDVRSLLSTGIPARIRTALAGLAQGGDAELCTLVEALYAERATLGTERFDVMLGRVRQTLRARLDRKMEYAS